MKRLRWILQGKWLVAYWLGLALIFLIMMLQRQEYDFGWHVAAGGYIRAHGVPMHDVYSYTASQFAWIDHEWLHDVMVSWLYGAGGYGLVAAVFALGWSAALLVASRRLVLPVLLLAAEALLPFSAARPEMWGFLLFAVTQRVLEARRRRQWVVLPVVAVLWANLHGSFPFLLLLLGAAWWRRRDRSTGLLLAVCAGLTLVNPYGVRVYAEIIRTLLDPGLGRYVQEWAALALPVMTILYAAGYALLWREFEPRRRLLTWPFAMLVAALVSARHAPFFVAASMRGFEDYVLKLDAKIRSGSHGRSLAMWLIFCALAGGMAQNTWFAAHTIGHDVAYQMPQAPAAFLADHPCRGQVFNDYDFGGYLLWKAPGLKTYVDGRMPSWRDVQGQRYVERYLKVVSDNNYRDEEFKRYHVTCAVLATGSGTTSASLVPVLKSQGWQVAARDNVSVLLLQ